jgi:hypothetical protein
MGVKAQDLVRSGEVRSDPNTAVASLVGPGQHDRDFARTIWEEVPPLGIDPWLAWTQGAYETINFTDTSWNVHKNPSGLDLDGTRQVARFGDLRDGTEAAKAHLACMNRLLPDPRPERFLGDLNPSFLNWLDTVWARHCREAAGAGIVVTTLADFGIRYDLPGNDWGATWGASNFYGIEWAQRANSLGTVPNQRRRRSRMRFPSARVFHAQPGAILRDGPDRFSTVVRQLQNGDAVTCVGYVRGQTVEGDDRWLQLTGRPPRYLHTSGVNEAIA